MYKNPKLAVDVIIVNKNKIALIKRRHEPFKGKWALPGGFVSYGEEPHRAAVREAEEETNLRVVLEDKTRAFVYGNPARDPRGHLISLVFTARTRSPERIRGKDDAADAKFFSRKGLPQRLAADHSRIIREVLGW